jgi:hypothetical protein
MKRDLGQEFMQRVQDTLAAAIETLWLALNGLLMEREAETKEELDLRQMGDRHHDAR